jgi:bifunctional non-homologous end joining protein LigD
MSTILVERTSASPPAGLPALDPIPYLARALPFDDPGWVFQPRYEGLRAFAIRSPEGCEIRAGRELRAERLAELGERVQAVLGRHEAVLDGDVVALDREGRPSLRELLKGRSLLAFGAFDLLWLDGEDLRGLPLSDRQQRLASLLPVDTGPLYKTFTLEEHGRALFQAACRMELEGIVAKRKQDPYGAGTVWYAIRNPGYTQDDGRIDPFRPRPRARRTDREPAES